MHGPSPWRLRASRHKTHVIASRATHSSDPTGRQLATRFRKTPPLVGQNDTSRESLGAARPESVPPKTQDSLTQASRTMPASDIPTTSANERDTRKTREKNAKLHGRLEPRPIGRTRRLAASRDHQIAGGSVVPLRLGACLGVRAFRPRLRSGGLHREIHPPTIPRRLAIGGRDFRPIASCSHYSSNPRAVTWPGGVSSTRAGMALDFQPMHLHLDGHPLSIVHCAQELPSGQHLRSPCCYPPV